MKHYSTRSTVLALMIWCCVAEGVTGQPEFGNLDFESPILPLNPANFQVPTSNALPGWTASIGSNTLSEVVYNTFSLGAPAVSLHDSGGSFAPLEGGYSVFLQAASVVALTSEPSLSQVGTVPLFANSLIFRANFTSLELFFDNQSLNFLPLSTASNHTIYGADISAFAGLSGELRIASPQLPGGGGAALIDSLEFSTTIVPEPKTMGLALSAALAVAWHSTRRRVRR